MRKNSIMTLVLLLSLVLLTVGIMGCSDKDTREGVPSNSSAETTNSTVMSATTPSADVNVSLNTQTEGIWVSGSGTVAVTPDIAVLQLGIEAQEATVAEAQAKASESMDKIKTALVDNGVAERDIQTRSFRISQRMRWDDEEQQEVVTGYRVTNDVIVTVRELEKVSGIIDDVVAAGGDYTRIDDLGFTVEDPSVYYDNAREEAMADARGKAEKIAELAGMQLGVPTYINESTSTPYLGNMVYEMAMSTAAPAPVKISTPLSPGEVEIMVTMQVAYEIEKAPSVTAVPVEPEIEQ